MKICFFGYCNLTKKEGASLSLMNVMEEMHSRGHEIFFVADTVQQRNAMEKLGIHGIYLRSYTMRRDSDEQGLKSDIKYILKRIINAVAIIRGRHELLKHRFDVIHINGIDNHVAAAIATQLRIPYFWHIRQFLQEDLGKRIVGEKIVMKYLRSANGVIGISRAVKEKYEDLLKRPVQLIYNGIPFEKYDVGEVERFRKNEVSMLIAGRVTENKGQMDAVKALKLLRDRGYDQIKLTIVGNAEKQYLKMIQDYIGEHDMQGCVSILDYCDDLNELRAAHDIGLVCSKYEAFGRVTIEYMCAKMFVIGANTGGTLELINDGNTGFLYQEGSYESLADRIQEAVDDRSRSSLIAENGKAFALSSFSIERVVDEILCMYQISRAVT